MATRGRLGSNNTQVERSGTGQQRPVSASDKTGVAEDGKAGRVERAGTGMVRQGLSALLVALWVLTPALGWSWQVKLSEQSGQVALLVQGADVVVAGSGSGQDEHHVFPVFALPEVDSEDAGTNGPDSEGAGTGGPDSEGAGTGGLPAVWGYAEATRAVDGSWQLVLFKSEGEDFTEVLTVSGLGD